MFTVSAPGSARLRALRSAIAVAAFALIAVLVLADPVVASCDAPASDPRCSSDFDGFRDVARTDDGYVAVGHLQGQPKSEWAVVHVSADGRRGPRVAIPAWRKDSDVVSVTFNRILALPKGALALIGSFQLSHSNFQSGVVLAIESNGRLRWAREWIETQNVLFQSGIYDPTANFVVAVGRRTSGADLDGTCRNWSQSYVQGINASNGALSDPIQPIGEATEGPSNRQAIYDISPTTKPERYVFVGFKSEPDPIPGHCRDRIQIGVLSPDIGGAGRWTAKTVTLPTEASGSEDGYAIRSEGPDDYVIAGQTGDLVNGPSLARAIRVKLNPLSIEGHFESPMSNLGAAQGAARFRIVTPIRDSAHLVFLGSKSSSAQGSGDIAFSQVASADLSKIENSVLAEDGAAEIYGAEGSPSGTVLTAGHAIDRKGRAIGWLEFVGSPDSRRASPSKNVQGGSPNIGASRRTLPDRSAPALFQVLTKVGPKYQLPDHALRSTSKYYISGLPSGLQVDIEFSNSSEIVILARLLTGAGDVDLALSDSDGRLVDFSNYIRGAPQLVHVRLQPGKYTLSLLAETDTRDVELDVGRTDEFDTSTLIDIATSINGDKWDKLADKLDDAGVSRPSEPSIAIGGETILSLIAANEAGASIERSIVTKLPRDTEK